MGKDAEFLYDTIDTYMRMLRKQIKRNSPIHGEKKSGRLSHVNLLKDALENEIHGR